MKTIMVTLAIQLVWEAIIIASSGIVFLATYFVRKQLQKQLRGKTMFFTGPEMAGKTTLINWITNKKMVKNYTPTTDKDTVVYKDEEHDFSITDMGGGVEFLETYGFDRLIREHDITVFVFDVNRFLLDDKYRQEEVCDRLDFLWHMEKEIDNKKILFIVGSHIDFSQKNDNEVRKEIGDFLKGKDYAKLIVKYQLFLADLTKEKEVKKIMNELKNRLKKEKQ